MADINSTLHFELVLFLFLCSTVVTLTYEQEKCVPVPETVLILTQYSTHIYFSSVVT